MSVEQAERRTRVVEAAAGRRPGEEAPLRRTGAAGAAEVGQFSMGGRRGEAGAEGADGGTDGTRVGRTRRPPEGGVVEGEGVADAEGGVAVGRAGRGHARSGP